jgi:FlaA1/EpsC-like NDP-sugar epimerase
MKNILITGGTGSLGHALVQRLYETCNITIFSRDETKQGKMKNIYPNCTYMLGDVSKLSDLELALRDIDTVFHFAAYKQVPSAQNNALSTVETNVIGSINVARASIMAGVKQVVASSTDKACQSVNLYGMSKAVMEAVYQDMNKYGGTTFHLTRYGNVVSSNASVVPLFQKQAAAGGPLTVTHKDMTRFWLHIQTAVDLILHALDVSPGIIVVPKAKALPIVDVATLIGGVDLGIKEIGIRPGEKIHEAMVSEAESFHTEYNDTDNISGLTGLFYIHPPKSSYRNSTAPFSYTSDTCERLADDEFLKMVL